MRRGAPSVGVLTPSEKEAFYREILSLAIPIALQSLLTSLIGATDALMLGRLNQESIAAAALANQIAFVMNLFISAVVNGGGVLISQYWGKGDRRMVGNLFCMMSKWALGISTLFFAAAMLVPEGLMRLYTPEPVLIEIGASYLRTVAPSYLFASVTRCFFLMMKVEGKAARSVVISIAALVTDMVLDLFLIYGLAGAPRLEANGSAWTTVAVELLTLLWCLTESRQKGRIRLDLAGLRWHSAAITKDFLKIALPMLGSSLAWGIGFSLHSMIMGHLGTDAAASASITAVMLDLVACVCRGVSAGAGIMLGKLLGQDLFDKAKIYGRKLCHLSFWAAGIHVALFALIGPLMAQVFVLTDTARHYLLCMMLFMCPYVAAYAINTVVVIGILPAGGDARYNAISVFFASWCFSLPLALVGTFVLHLPVMAVYMLMMADEIVKLPWLLPRYRKYLWLKNLTRQTTDTPLHQ